MYDKLKADVEFLNGNHEIAADMYLEGAREGDSLVFNGIKITVAKTEYRRIIEVIFKRIEVDSSDEKED